MTRWIGSAAALALTLTACGGGSEGDDVSGSGAAGNVATPVGSASANGGAGVSLEPGRWETTTELVSVKSDMPGMEASMPKGKSNPTSVCVTPEQAAEPMAILSPGWGISPDCKYNNMSSAGVIQAKTQCDTQGGSAQITVKGQATPTSYEIEHQSIGSAQGMSTTSVMRISGRRVGDC